jgi:hypothetical protein
MKKYLELLNPNLSKFNPTTANMPPKKAVRPAQENISLGPQVRDGTFFLAVLCFCAAFYSTPPPKLQGLTYIFRRTRFRCRKNLRLLQRYFRPHH